MKLFFPTRNNFCLSVLFFLIFLLLLALHLTPTHANETMAINGNAINNNDEETQLTDSLLRETATNRDTGKMLAKGVVSLSPWRRRFTHPLISVKLFSTLKKLQEASERSAHQQMVTLSPLFLLIFIGGLFGNLLVISVCLRDFSKTNALLFSLAVSDLTMLFVNLPTGFYRHLHFDWPFGSLSCKGVNFLRHLSVYTSSFSNIIIALHRYLSVCCSLQLSAGSGSGGGGSGKSTSPSTLVRQLYFWERCGGGGGIGGGIGGWIGGSNRRQYRTAFAMTVIFSPWIAAAAFSLHCTWNSTRARRFTSLYSLIGQHADKLIEASQYTLLPNSTTTSSSINRTSRQEEEEYMAVPSDRQLTIVRCISKPSPLAAHFWRHYGLDAVKFDTVTVFLTQYLLPLVICSVLYARVGWTIHRQGQLLTRTGEGTNNLYHEQRQRNKRRRIWMLFCVVAIFALSWSPLHFYYLLTDFNVFQYENNYFIAFYIIAMLSAVSNPIIYWRFNVDFSRAFAEMFRRCQRCTTCSVFGEAVVRKESSIQILPNGGVEAETTSTGQTTVLSISGHSNATDANLITAV